MRVAMLGAPGCGKGGQARRIAARVGVPCITINELLRHAAAAETDFGRLARLSLESTGPTPDEIVLGVLREAIAGNELANGFVLDGFPRTLAQARALDELLRTAGMPLERVILIEIETDRVIEQVVGRRSCVSCGHIYNIYTDPPRVDGICDLCGGRLHQRASDREAAISNQMRVYDIETAPIANHYAGQGILRRIEDRGDRDQTYFALLELVKDLPGPSQGVGEKIASLKQAAPRKAAPRKAAPRKAAPRKAAPKKAAPKKAAPKQATPKKAAPKRATPKKAAPKKAAPKQATPKQATPKQATPKQATPKQATPKQAAPKKAAPKKAAPKKAAPKKAAPKKAAPKKAAPKKATPKQAAPKKAAPKKATPKKAAPKKAAPKKATPKKATPKKAAPKRATPKKSAPNRSGPKKTTPKNQKKAPRRARG